MVGIEGEMYRHSWNQVDNAIFMLNNNGNNH